MKKLSVLLMVGVFLITGTIMNSCTKDEPLPEMQQYTMVVKVASDYDLPIRMGQNTWIGEAFIYINGNGDIQVDVDLDEVFLAQVGLVVFEADLYASMEAPTSHAPGHFPYELIAPGYDFTFDPIPWEPGQSEWYFALHLQLGNDLLETETAWVIPAENGSTWSNKNGKAKGWGMYFLWLFE